VKPVFIGDEASAAAWRLAGFDARIVAPREFAALWPQLLREQPPLILVAAACAAALPGEALDAALARLDPPVAVVPDVANTAAPPDLLPRVRASLGIGA
jgi:hypothetical protein